jgi:transcription elongation factor Elf1
MVMHRMYECFHCGQRAVIWDSDFDFDDFDYEGEGIVHICHCTNCGAEIEYDIPIDGEESDDDN